ncbi:Rieske 2Fe-2S domain-containing protein [Frankia sp. R82]|uniref:Rieske 2Fe-2S domain-containing protein n=1 Tax=Frankia sp. R82 TaxID=2950553 RepID=UPI002043654D|nr:Rieske 2Fe-2S domain-containing protein [Frankia sp. R82]MCM3886271.1 Rieske 2Fe-2S domain-containing protein [Frankia sp. R82]
MPDDAPEQWHPVCHIDEIPEGEAVVLPTTPPIAVFNVDGELFATDDTRSHAESSLAEGYIEDGTVECVPHFARFCLRTGKARSPRPRPRRHRPTATHRGTSLDHGYLL